ncbi:MAG TPA: hypothetical protein VFS16_20140, partial [Acidimicrobiia bacterium]|nr:hypothetical protein [Acidimicrobiia bacterium]
MAVVGRGKAWMGMLSAVVGLALAAFAPGSAAGAECTTTWVGPAEGSWLVAGNWSTGLVPGE